MTGRRRTRVGRSIWPLAAIVALPAVAFGGGRSAPPITRLTEVTAVTDGPTAGLQIRAVGSLKYRARWLDHPRRLVLDFDDATHQLRNMPLDFSGPPLKQIRASQYREKVVRVVLEFAGPVRYAIRKEGGGLFVVITPVAQEPPTDRRTIIETDRLSEPRDTPVAGMAAAPAGTTPGDSIQPATAGMSMALRASPGGEAFRVIGGEARKGFAGGAWKQTAWDAEAMAVSPTGHQVLATSQVAFAESPPEQGLTEERRDRRTLDTDRLKRKLQQLPSTPVPGTPVPGPRTRETLELTLDQGVDIALKYNLGVRIASLAKEEARLAIPRASAAFHPVLGLAVVTAGADEGITNFTRTGSFFESRITPFVRQNLPTATSLILSGDFGREEIPKRSDAYTSAVTLSVVQPVLRGGRIYVATRPIRDAEFNYRIADDRLRAEVLRTIARTKSSYYTVLLTQKVVEAIEAAIGRDKSLMEASEALFRARLVTKRDVYSAELSFAQDTARLVSAQADLEIARNALRNVLGLPIGTILRSTDQEIDFEPVPIELERWIAIATKNRPEIRDFEEQLAKSRLDIEVARNARLPQLDLVASYGRGQVDPSFSQSLRLDGDRWSAGLVFSIPFGNVASRSALAQAEAEHAILEDRMLQTERQIELEVRAAATKLHENLERMKSLTVAIDQARGKLEVGRAQFALGQATNLDITDAQQSLLEAETNLLTAIINYNIAVAELQAALADDRASLFERTH
jgi:OMF family outer membrane factor